MLPLSAMTNTYRLIRIGKTVVMILESILQYKNLLLYDNSDYLCINI